MKTITLKKAIRLIRKNKECRVYYTWNKEKNSAWRRIKLRQKDNYFMPPNGNIETSNDLLTVWDIDQKGWRNIKLKTIKYLELHGDKLFNIKSD